jgi:hypothetical protein
MIGTDIVPETMVLTKGHRWEPEYTLLIIHGISTLRKYQNTQDIELWNLFVNNFTYISTKDDCLTLVHLYFYDQSSSK